MGINKIYEIQCKNKNSSEFFIICGLWLEQLLLKGRSFVFSFPLIVITCQRFLLFLSHSHHVQKLPSIFLSIQSHSMIFLLFLSPSQLRSTLLSLSLSSPSSVGSLSLVLLSRSIDASYPSLITSLSFPLNPFFTHHISLFPSYLMFASSLPIIYDPLYASFILQLHQRYNYLFSFSWITLP